MGVAFAVAGALTPAVRAAARRYGLVVAPRQDRWHTRPTALYGGVAIGLAAAAGWGLIAAGGTLFGHAQALVIMGAAAVLFVVGLVDDARGLSPSAKFILQLAAATLVVGAGVVYPATPWNPVNVLVTLFWFVGITNALNLLDNMDGASAGVAVVAAGAFAVLYAAAGDLVMAALALGVAGAAAGFLVFNFKPASIFMGDVGSLFLGGALAGLGAAYPRLSGTDGPVALLVPALVLLVPILDTTLVSFTRILNDRPVSVGGRDHTTHRLVAMGFSEAGAALFLYAFAAASFAVAWVVVHAQAAAGLWLAFLFLAGSTLFAGYLGTLHRYEPLAGTGSRRRPLLRTLLLKRNGLEILLDVVLFGAAFYGAFVIYYNGDLPREAGALANAALGPAIVLKLVAFHWFRVYRGLWTRADLADVHRIVKATLLAGLLVIGGLFLAVRGAEIPRAVFVLDVLLTGTLALIARTSFQSLNRLSGRLRPAAGIPTLIHGSGRLARFAAEALVVRPVDGFRPIGFVSGDEMHEGRFIEGLPVVGTSASSLARACATLRARAVLIPADALAAEGGADLRCRYRDAGLRLVTFGVIVQELSAEGPAETECGREERVTRGLHVVGIDS